MQIVIAKFKNYNGVSNKSSITVPNALSKIPISPENLLIILPLGVWSK
jgi:hypothetical protein